MRLAAQAEIPTYKDMETPDHYDDCSGYAEMAFEEMGIDLYCAYCPHVKHSSKWIVATDGAQYYETKFGCKSLHFCPDEDAYELKFAEMTVNDRHMEEELKELGAVEDIKIGIGLWS